MPVSKPIRYALKSSIVVNMLSITILFTIWFEKILIYYRNDHFCNYLYFTVLLKYCLSRFYCTECESKWFKDINSRVKKNCVCVCVCVCVCIFLRYSFLKLTYRLLFGVTHQKLLLVNLQDPHFVQCWASSAKSRTECYLWYSRFGMLGVSGV